MSLRFFLSASRELLWLNEKDWTLTSLSSIFAQGWDKRAANSSLRIRHIESKIERGETRTIYWSCYETEHMYFRIFLILFLQKTPLVPSNLPRCWSSKRFQKRILPPPSQLHLHHLFLTWQMATKPPPLSQVSTKIWFLNLQLLLPRYRGFPTKLVECRSRENCPLAGESIP